MNTAELENELAYLMRAKYGDNAVEALVGALSSVITPNQLTALINSLTPPTNQEWTEVIR